LVTITTALVSVNTGALVAFTTGALVSITGALVSITGALVSITGARVTVTVADDAAAQFHHRIASRCSGCYRWRGGQRKERQDWFGGWNHLQHFIFVAFHAVSVA